MKSRSSTGKRRVAGTAVNTAPHRGEISAPAAANEPWSGAFSPAVHESEQAAMATVSRCANHALTEQLQQVHRGAEQARDYARAAAAFVATHLPPGTARDALAAGWARHEADAERMMAEVLRFGREHGHLAFAFTVYG